MFEHEPREKVRLYLWTYKEKTWEFDDPSHQPVPGLSLRPYQIVGRFCLGHPAENHLRYWCLIDTGAMLTLIPREVWEPAQDQIRWLHTTDGSFTSTKVGGHAFSLRLGLVTIHFLDYDQNSLSRQIIAGCVTNAEKLKLMVLGLGGGQAIVSGGLCLNVVENSLWLVTV
jgi:hypothetical protein